MIKLTQFALRRAYEHFLEKRGKILVAHLTITQKAEYS